MQTLKPCPFCGSNDARQEFNNGEPYVRCVDCGCSVDGMSGAWNTRPTAPVEGLETAVWQWTDNGGYNANYRYSTVDPREDTHEVYMQGADGVQYCVELVTRSQAESIIAAKDREIAELKKDREQADFALVDKYRDPKYGRFVFPDDVAAIIRKLDATEADNAALTARVKDLEDECNELVKTSNEVISQRDHALNLCAQGDEEKEARVALSEVRL